MPQATTVSRRGVGQSIRAGFAAPWIRWLAMLGVCAAYVQGGFDKATDFSAAIAEMRHFGIAAAAPMAAVVTMLEIGASVMILTGFYRWLGALALGCFTLMATFLANQFWNAVPPERLALANSFFEHLGLVGAFLLIAWHDLHQGTK
ncbi:DoxX family protein [Variovorax sp. GT1P44]|uniref:DoxX family protein n=1 Tax=Variovorax sp. GT1P44 TaxID=3443742 RepID=UPI003F47C8D1